MAVRRQRKRKVGRSCGWITGLSSYGWGLALLYVLTQSSFLRLDNVRISHSFHFWLPSEFCFPSIFSATSNTCKPGIVWIFINCFQFSVEQNEIQSMNTDQLTHKTAVSFISQNGPKETFCFMWFTLMCVYRGRL